MIKKDNQNLIKHKKNELKKCHAIHMLSAGQYRSSEKGYK